MKLCPTCGEVYARGATECRAHGTKLRDWTDVTETSGGITSVDRRATTTVDDHTSSPPTVRTPTLSTVVYDSDEAETPVPDRILHDRYRLGRQIGIGGYGAVFAAIDERTGKRVAIKLLSPALANDHEAITRFRREAIAASRVAHPGIVDVTDFFIEPEATSYIVMEYLDGEDLSDVLDVEGQLPPARALDIAAQCADALGAAHAAHILHRDLKPANIFLTTEERRRDVVRIIDFGISKITQGEGRYTDLTSASKVVGTPFYMSPEQAQGKQLDGRTDVYSLGVILYRMLTGKRPFVGDSALDILTKHIEAKRVPPSRVEPELARYPKLDQLVLRAIAARTESRYASMAEFRLAILDCLEGIDAEVAARLEGTMVIDRAPVAARSHRELTGDTLGASSGQITRKSRVARARSWRIGSIGLAAAAAALLTFWLTRSPTSSPTAAPETAPQTAPSSATTPRAARRAAPASTVPPANDDEPEPTSPPAPPAAAAATDHQAQPTQTPPQPTARAPRPARAHKRRAGRAKPKRHKRRRKDNGNLGIKDW